MSLHSTSTSSSGEEASDQKIGRSKSASTTIEFLKRELEKYKSSVVELVDEVLFAENQLSVRDDTIKKLKSEIHRMTELNSQKDMKINDLLLAPPLPPPPQIIHEVKNSDTISHYEFRMSQMENEIKNYRELYDKAKEQIDLFEQERNLIEEENHNLSSDLNTLYAEKHMALLEIEKLKALLEQASKPQMQQQQQHHHHHHMNQTQDTTKFIDTTRPHEILDMIESEDQLDVPMRDEEKKLLDKLQEVLHNTDINSFLSDSAKTVSKFEDTLSSFKEKLEEANMNREEEFMTLLKSQEDQLITLSVENSELKKKLQFLEDNNREEELSNIVKSQEHQIAQLTSENQQFKSKLEEMSSMYESATKSFKQEKEKLIDELTSREEELDLLLKGQESQMISLRSTNRDLNEQIQKHEEYNRELVDKIEDLSARYEDKIDNIRTEAEKMKEELTVTRKENKSLISKYEKLRVKMVELKTKLGSSRSTVSKDLEEVSSRIATIEESYTLKEKAYIEKLEKQTKEYEDTLAKVMKENEEIVNALRVEVESLLEERKLADLPSDKVESLVSDLKIANAKVKAQKEGIEELKKDINDAKQHIADIQDAVSVVIDALKTSPTEDEVHTFSNKPSNPYDKQKERKEQHVSTILSNKLIKKLQDVAQALDVKTKLLDTRLQLNISTENNRKIQAKLSEKENLLEQAIVYVNKVQVEYEKMQRLLKSLEEEKQKLEVDLASRTKQLQLMKVEQYKRARATRSADDAPR